MATFHQVLPPHLVAKVFDCLDTKERARIALVCKSWRGLSEDNWTSLSLSFSALEQLAAQRRWLDKVAARAADTVHTFELKWQGGKLLHPAAGSLHIEQFVNLEVLRLKPAASAYWAMNPKAIQCLAQLKRLKELVLAFSPSSTSRAEIVTLEQFAIFPRLQLLSVMLTPFRGWEAGWHVVLSPALEGLRQLHSLMLGGVTRLHVTATLLRLVERLRHLDLEVKEDLLQDLHAPGMESLRYKRSLAIRLPFQGLTKLAELSYLGQRLQPHELAANLLLERLTLGYTLSTVTAAYVSSLAPLQSLRELRIHFFRSSGGQETLEPFAALGRLEKLHLTISCPRPVAILPCAALSRLQHLRELKIMSHTSEDIALGAGFEVLPSLESLHVEASRAVCPLASASVRHLSLEGTCGCRMSEYPTIGDLLQLRSISLKLVPDMRECTILAAQLAHLPHLRELFLVKGYAVDPAHRGQFGQPGALGRPEAAGTFERMLHSLRQLQGLHTLQVAAINDSVSLSRTILPQVEHLGLACKGLAVCASSLPWGCSSLNLVFRTANRNTHELLEHSAELSSYKEQVTHRTVWKARLPCQGQLQYDFAEDLFDDDFAADDASFRTGTWVEPPAVNPLHAVVRMNASIG